VEQADLESKLWPPGDEPGFIDDFAVIRQLPQAPIQTIFLSTDLGVYAIDFGAYKAQPPTRLSLPGLGAVCMALSAVSLEHVGLNKDSYDFLWAADAQGDSHLFGRMSGFHPPPFRPSGIVHVGSQVMLAISWQRPASSSIVFAQARRNDAIAFSVYTVVPPGGAPRGHDSQQQNLFRYRHLLLYGTLDDLRAETEATEDWPAYAVVSDFFELLASRDDDGRRALEEFLSNPSGATAHLALKSLPRQEVQAAVRLWVLTLLGIVNRLKKAGEAPYLGIVRWLRDLEFQARGDDDLEQALAPAVRKGIRFARKWGLFGKANAQRGHLVKPLEILRSQLSGPEGAGWNPEVGRQSEAIDLLTYESLLFHRSFDILHEDTRGQMRGRSAWDLAVLEEASRQLVTVSWMWGGVELYEVRGRRKREIEFDLQLALVPDPSKPYQVPVYTFPAGNRREPHESWQEKHGYSRAILLGKVDGHSFLLTAPTLEDRSRPERLHLWEILEDHGRLTVKPSDPGEHNDLTEGESVYRFLELEPGWILAGLRGIGGRPRLALLAVEVDPERGLTLTRQDFDLPSSGAGSATTLQNRVWSLARAIPRSLRRRDDLPDQPYRVAVGCESGEILAFTLPRRSEPRNREIKIKVKVEPVAQMSSPVVSLAYLSGYAVSDGGQADRIFAGGEDGAIVAWQKLSGNHGGFASLWSTVEQGPVAAIHPLPYGSPGSGQEPRVLAVTRMGRCAIFDDRSELQAPSARTDDWRPQRPWFPGKRLRRSQLGGTAFASGLLCRLPPAGAGGEPVWNEETGRYAALLTASEQGELRVVTLHYPQSPQRQQQYDRIVDLWWQIAYRGGQHDLLRLVDAAYQAVPLLPMLVVRWILDPEVSRRAGVSQAPPVLEKRLAWKMPRYLRPLLELYEAWESHDARTAAHALEDLLLQAWRHEDLALFQQLCALVLKRANFAIRKAAEQTGGNAESEKVCELFLAIFEILERSLQRWLGNPEREARARIAVAKNLVDGDTFLSVLRQANRKTGEEEPFRRILAKRIEGVRQLVFKHDSLLSLETFRALNLSLMRLCRRLVGTSGPEGRREEVSWTVFASYFEALTYSAARTFRSRLEMNDSLAHEYCRTFALAVCACPSAAIRIANRMTETQLISDPDSEQDLSRRVIRQFDVLAQIGIPVPGYAVELFRMASFPPQQELNPVRRVLRSLNLPEEVARSDDRQVIARVGAENAEDLHCLCRLYRVIDWFVKLAERLSTDAKGIDLTAENLGRLSSSLQCPDEDPLGRLYAHSVRFWTRGAQCAERARAPGGFGGHDPPGNDPPQPEAGGLGRAAERRLAPQLPRPRDLSAGISDLPGGAGPA
jgi:hypothetical protein